MTELFLLLFPSNYVLLHSAEDDPQSIKYDVLMELLSFVFQNRRRRVDWESYVTFKTLRIWNQEFSYPAQHLVCKGPRKDVCISAETL